MSPFTVFGLPRSADEISIKRAYARLLKQHRPDEDPAGFQRINEAFQACIALARRQATAAFAGAEDNGDEFEEEWQEDEDDGELESRQAETDGSHPALTGDQLASFVSDPALIGHVDDIRVPSQEREPMLDTSQAIDAMPGHETVQFELTAFVDELLQIDRTRPDELGAWLLGHEALYSLELKEAVVEPLVQDLLHRPQRLSPGGMAIVLDFFHLDTVHNGHPWLAGTLEELREKYLSAAHFEDFVAFHTKGAKLPPRGPGVRSTPIEQLIMRELLGPSNLLRRLFLSLMPSLPSRTLSTASFLHGLDNEYAQERLDQAAIRWWQQVAGRRSIHWRRALLVFVRLLLVSTACAWLFAEAPAVFSWSAMANTAAWTGGLWLAYALSSMAMIRTGEWQRAHPRIHLRSLCVLGLLALAVGLALGTEPIFALYVFIPAVWLLLTEPPMQGRTIATLAVVLGTGVFAALANYGPMLTDHLGVALSLSLTAACLVVLAHDTLYARSQYLSMPQVRRINGFLPYVIAGYAAAILLLMLFAHFQQTAL